MTYWITREAVIGSGACQPGAVELHQMHVPDQTAIDPETLGQLQNLTQEQQYWLELVQQFLSDGADVRAARGDGTVDMNHWGYGDGGVGTGYGFAYRGQQLGDGYGGGPGGDASGGGYGYGAGGVGYGRGDDRGDGCSVL